MGRAGDGVTRSRWSVVPPRAGAGVRAGARGARGSWLWFGARAHASGGLIANGHCISWAGLAPVGHTSRDVRTVGRVDRVPVRRFEVGARAPNPWSETGTSLSG